MSETKYFIHFNSVKNTIVGAGKTKHQFYNNIEIENDLALKFMTGEESLVNWFITQDEITKEYEIVKIVSKSDRFNGSRLVEVKSEKENADIILTLDTSLRKLFVLAKNLKKFDFPISIYLTRKDDPTSLYVRIKVDKEIDLFKDDIDINPYDLSIFAIKSPIKISLKII